MVMNLWSAGQVRAAEQPHLEREEPLMARAAAALAQAVRETLEEVSGTEPQRDPGQARAGGVVLLVGAGNNGGDALYAGAELAGQGIRVTAVLLARRHHEDGLAALLAAGGSHLALPETAPGQAVDVALDAAVVVDGILGTGAHGGLREEAAAVVGALADALRGRRADRRDGGAPAPEGRPAPAGGRGLPRVVACDVPSGLDASTGVVSSPVLPADTTVTFGGTKAGLVAAPGENLVGRIRTVQIGIEQDLPEPVARVMEPADLPRWWSAPGPQDHKYTRGVLGTLVGSAAYPGAGLMAVRAAVLSGAGMVRWVGQDGQAPAMALHVPEAVRGSGPGDHVQAWVAGSGLDTAADSAQDAGEGPLAVLEEILDRPVPVVADAAAVAVVARRAAAGHPVPARVLVTPHAGELAQALQTVVESEHTGAERARALHEAATSAGLVEQDLPETGQAPGREGIEAAPLVWAAAAHRVLGATVLLKGSVTVVAGERGTWVHRGGSPWLATAGSGDTLTGILGAALACAEARWENAPQPGGRQGAAEARTEKGEEPEAPVEQDAGPAGKDGPDVAAVAAAALLVQAHASALEPGPCPPSVLAQRLPSVLGRLLGPGTA